MSEESSSLVKGVLSHAGVLHDLAEKKHRQPSKLKSSKKEDNFFLWKCWPTVQQEDGPCTEPMY